MHTAETCLKRREWSHNVNTWDGVTIRTTETCLKHRGRVNAYG